MSENDEFRSKENDIRVVKPIKVFDEFRKAEAFMIPCIVREITNISHNHKRDIKIEIINFDSGKWCEIPAITYERALEFMQDFPLPLKTVCKVMKNNFSNKFDFIVYGLYNTGEILNYINGENINLSEIESMRIFKENYIEINNWINS